MTPDDLFKLCRANDQGMEWEEKEVDDRPIARKILDKTKQIGGMALAGGLTAGKTLTSLATPLPPQRVDPRY